jgi:hypothetical protein
MGLVMMRSFESKSPATDNGFRATFYEEMSHEWPTMANKNADLAAIIPGERSAATA